MCPSQALQCLRLWKWGLLKVRLREPAKLPFCGCVDAECVIRGCGAQLLLLGCLPPKTAPYRDSLSRLSGLAPPKLHKIILPLNSDLKCKHLHQSTWPTSYWFSVYVSVCLSFLHSFTATVMNL